MHYNFWRLMSCLSLMANKWSSAASAFDHKCHGGKMNSKAVSSQSAKPLNNCTTKECTALQTTHNGFSTVATTDSNKEGSR